MSDFLLLAIILYYWHCPHSMQTRDYVTARFPSVCMSVPPVCLLQLRAPVCCWGPGGEEISIDCCVAGAATPQRAAANAGSGTFTAGVGSWRVKTDFIVASNAYFQCACVWTGLRWTWVWFRGLFYPTDAFEYSRKLQSFCGPILSVWCEML